MTETLSIFLKKNFILLTIILFALFLYTFKLGSIPFALHGDESETALQAIEISKINTGIIGVGWYDIPLLSFLPHTISMAVFGQTITGNRIASVFFGIGTLLLFYLLIQLLIGRRPAAIATFLLSTSHMWIALSRFGTIYTQAAFFVVGSLYFTFRGIHKRNALDFAIGGIFFSLCFYSYYAARIAPFILFPCFILCFILDKFPRKFFIQLTFFAVAAIITFLPQGVFFVNHPDSFLSRIKYVSITNNLSEQDYVNKTIPEILVLQTQKTFNGIFIGDNSGQYGYKGQLFDYATIIFAIIGFVWILISFDFLSFIIILWLILAVATSQILTIGPPPIFLPRFIVGIPALFVICSLGIEFMLKKTKKYSKIINSVIVIIILIITFNNLFIYFFKYPNQQKEGIAGDPNAYNATEIARFINKSNNPQTVIFLTAPYIYADFGPIRFLSPKKSRVGIDNVANYIIDGRYGKNTLYVIYPQYAYKIPELLSVYPKGTITQFTNGDENVRFTIFSSN